MEISLLPASRVCRSNHIPETPWRCRIILWKPWHSWDTYWHSNSSPLTQHQEETMEVPHHGSLSTHRRCWLSPQSSLPPVALQAEVVYLHHQLKEKPEEIKRMNNDFSKVFRLQMLKSRKNPALTCQQWVEPVSANQDPCSTVIVFSVSKFQPQPKPYINTALLKRFPIVPPPQSRCFHDHNGILNPDHCCQRTWLLFYSNSRDSNYTGPESPEPYLSLHNSGLDHNDMAGTQTMALAGLLCHPKTT